MHTFLEVARITSGHRKAQWHFAKTPETFPKAVRFSTRFLGRKIRNKREYNSVGRLS